jgi:uncharacterized membrane protein
MDTPNNNVSDGFSTQQASGKNVPMGVLAYLGPLVIVSYIIAKGDSFVKFHIKQGLVIFVVEAAVWILGMFLHPLWFLLSLINLASLVFAVIGIINVVNGREKELPYIGQYSKYFTF